MPNEDELAELLALAMALTGRPGAAAELVGGALASAAGRSTDPEAQTALRNRMVRDYVETRGDSNPTDTGTNADPDLPDELAQVVARLYQLPRRQRACAVLTLRERLTHREIAGLLDRPPVPSTGG